MCNATTTTRSAPDLETPQKISSHLLHTITSCNFPLGRSETKLQPSVKRPPKRWHTPSGISLRSTVKNCATNLMSQLNSISSRPLAKDLTYSISKKPKVKSISKALSNSSLPPLKRKLDTLYDCLQPKFKLNMKWRLDLDSPKIVIKTKLWSPSNKSTQTKPTSSIENRKDRSKSQLLASTTSKIVPNVKILCREVLALALVSNSLIIRRCSQFTTEFKIWDSLSWIRIRVLLRKSNQKLRLLTISAANFAAGPPHPLWSSTKRRPIKWWRHNRRMHSRSSRRWCTRSRSQTQEPKTRRVSNQSRQAR